MLSSTTNGWLAEKEAEVKKWVRMAFDHWNAVDRVMYTKTLLGKPTLLVPPEWRFMRPPLYESHSWWSFFLDSDDNKTLTPTASPPPPPPFEFPPDIVLLPQSEDCKTLTVFQDDDHDEMQRLEYNQLAKRRNMHLEKVAGSASTEDLEFVRQQIVQQPNSVMVACLCEALMSYTSWYDDNCFEWEAWDSWEEISERLVEHQDGIYQLEFVTLGHTTDGLIHAADKFLQHVDSVRVRVTTRPARNNSTALKVELQLADSLYCHKPELAKPTVCWFKECV